MSMTQEREVAIFNAARKLPAEERPFYLEGACAGDTLLRQQVEQLLEANDAAGTLLAELATGPGEDVRTKDMPSPGPTLRISLPPSESPGDKIGRYKLMEQVGEGGCGVVYVAEQVFTYLHH